MMPIKVSAIFSALQATPRRLRNVLICTETISATCRGRAICATGAPITSCLAQKPRPAKRPAASCLRAMSPGATLRLIRFIRFYL